MKIRELLDEQQTVGQVAGNLGNAFNVGKQAGGKVNFTQSALGLVSKLPMPNIGGNRTQEQELRKQQVEALRTAREEARKREEEARKREAEIRAQFQQAFAALRQQSSPTPESYIREHSTELPDNLGLILRNLIGRANEQDLPSEMTYLALSELLKPLIGDVTLNKDNFTSFVNNDPDLKNYFEITDTGVTLQTDAKFKPKQQSQTADDLTNTGTDKNSTVAGMARRGLKYMNDIRN